MTRPADAGKPYDFPTDVDKLTDRDLGNLQLKLAGWVTYVQGVLGRESVELNAFETVYEIRLGAVMQANSARSDKRILKDVLRAVSITDDESLTQLTQALVTRRMQVGRLESQVKIYERQLQTLSREQSRRESLVRANAY